jgi:hypothetical protein
MRHFDHGCAVTIHIARGLTAESVLIHADTGVHPNLLSSRFACLSVSRASHDAPVYTNSTASLPPSISHDASKTSALESGNTSWVGQGIGIGI